MLQNEYAVILNYNSGLRFIKLPEELSWETDVEDYISSEEREDPYDDSNEVFTVISRAGLEVIKEMIEKELKTE